MIGRRTSWVAAATAIYFLMPLVLGACVSVTEARRELSSGRVGCRPSEIKIVDETNWSWTAICDDNRFYCSGGSSIECKPAPD
jgi:hypothetical protein